MPSAFPALPIGEVLPKASSPHPPKWSKVRVHLLTKILLWLFYSVMAELEKLGPKFRVALR